ncbi:hypothetical protein DPX16_4860 [Anabarilius grahami]|uniref:Uncharacterized protein n=1 Tax=Anabarilius grahami TaxID=495550 RepID=A0A3N0Y189_ANAGA|nr:hypothetical protein DPX16_4860 [Anabarilius grahami]
MRYNGVKEEAESMKDRSSGRKENSSFQTPQCCLNIQCVMKRYTELFTCSYDDETLKSLFWNRANYHHPVDLPDTSGLDWREAIIRCLESVCPRSRTQPDPEPSPPPPSAAETLLEPPAPATISEAKPEEEGTALTIAPRASAPECDCNSDSSNRGDTGGIGHSLPPTLSHPESSVSSASDVTLYHRLSICTLGSISSASASHPPDVVGHSNILAAPSVDSAVGCHLCRALGPLHRALAIIATGFLRPPVTICLLFSVTIPSSSPRPPPPSPLHTPVKLTQCLHNSALERTRSWRPADDEYQEFQSNFVFPMLSDGLAFP